MEDSSPLRWTGSFSILPPAAIESRNLGGDKILLPHTALEQLLAAATPRQPEGSRPTALGQFNAYTAFRSDLTAPTDNAQQLPHPLMFRLVNPANGRVVYAGIREFSAPEGTIGMSPFLLDACGISSEDLATAKTAEDEVGSLGVSVGATPLQVTVHAHQLPRGTYVRLRPLEAGYEPDDWKPLLERQLRESFTTLTRNAVLSVNGVHGEVFQFLADRFTPEEDGICVVDTDLEVDIEALNEEQARETLRRVMAKTLPASPNGTSNGGELDVWRDVQGQVTAGEYVDYVLPSWDRSRAVDVVLSQLEDDSRLDLFVNPRSSRHRALPRDSVHVWGDFSPARHGVKTITLSPTNAEMEDAECLLISVHGYQESGQSVSPRSPLRYGLRARAIAAADESPVDSTRTDSEAHSADEEQCQNCLQWVPKRTMVLHTPFCRRNNVVCPACKAVFKRGSEEWEAHWHCEQDDAHGDSQASRAKHNDIYHGYRQCPSCPFATNSLSDLARHRTSTCPGKIILCRFCHLEVPQDGDPFNPSPEVAISGMAAHELADGARTTECHLCDRIVRLRDMETHLKHHELDKVGRPKPRICRNAKCGRTLDGVGARGQVGGSRGEKKAEGGAGNRLGLCSHCYGPLYVSMQDPEGKALRRRIERRYLGQMMTGCGKQHCANEWCKTGRANSGLESRRSSTQTVLPLVKPLLAAVDDGDGKEPMHFCVDEAGEEQRQAAEALADEKAWDLEWCVAAAEAERGNLERMRDWLLAWAPRR